MKIHCLLLSLLHSLTLCMGLSAQERTPLEAPRPALPSAPHAAATRLPLPPPEELEITHLSQNIDDQPDFAPMENALDDKGMVVGTRLKGNPYVLAFRGGEYVPKEEIGSRLVEGLRASPTQSTYGFVMIEGRMSDWKMRTLRDLGLELLGAHTYQSVKAKIPLSSLGALSRLPWLHWVGYAQPAQKLAPELARALEESTEGELFQIRVNCFASDLTESSAKVVVGTEQADETGQTVSLPIQKWIPHGPFQKALEAEGFDFCFYSDRAYAFRGYATAKEIRSIQKLDFVLYIEPVLIHQLNHDQTMGMIGQDRVRGSYPGNDVTVGIIDSGIESDPWHRDFSGKGFLSWKTTVGSAYEDGFGHGTHVSGTIFGQGLSDVRYKGAAPALGGSGNARIFIGRYFDNDGKAVGDVTTIYDGFSRDRVYGGVTHKKPSVINCSWGTEPADKWIGTEGSSRDVDDAVYNNNQCYVFSSGNRDKRVSNGCSAPACAKNVLTVGAVIDFWDPSCGYLFIGCTPGVRYGPSRYGVKDGRIKPEVVAPGEIVTSCRAGTRYTYTDKAGTSMAAPHVTGALASLIDRNSFYEYKPAALKAVAMAAATVENKPTRNEHQGFGLINSSRMNVHGTTTYLVKTGSLSRSGTWQSADIAILDDVHAVKVVLTWIEPKASAGAAKARLNDVRAYFDLPAYSGSGNTGEFNISCSYDNTIYHLSYAKDAGSFAQRARGKTVRFKIYAQSIASSWIIPKTAKYALCVLQYKKSTTIRPEMTTTISTTAVKPGGSFVLDATFRAPVTATDFNSARIWDASPGDITVTRMERTTPDGILQQYRPGIHPSFPFPSVTGGMVVGQGLSRSLRFHMRAGALTGNRTLITKGSYRMYDEVRRTAVTKTTSWAKVLCVDSSAPGQIRNLQSSTHTPGEWSRNSRATFTWDRPVDVGCAGVGGMAYRLSKGGPSVPTVKSTSGVSTSAIVLMDPAVKGAILGYYFNVRAVDKAGNLSSRNASSGPYYIDDSEPFLVHVTIEDSKDNKRTGSLLVKVTAKATDTYSGPHMMRYSSNGQIWSAWLPYTASTRIVDLSANGGNKLEGLKRLYAQVKDKAGNLSNIQSDTIYYMAPPTLNSAKTASLPSVNSSYYRLFGTNLKEVESVDFGGKLITTRYTSLNNDAWATGCFRITGDTVIDIFPPQGLPPGSYVVKVYNGLSTSKGFTVKVTANTTRTIRSSSRLTAGKPQVLMVHKAGLPSGTTTIVMISTRNVPSTIPGLVTMAIGEGWTRYILLPELPFDTNGVASITLPILSTFKGLTGYFQAAYLHRKEPSYPLPTSNVWKTIYL